MTYAVVYEKSVSSDAAGLSASALKAIKNAIDSRLATHPLQYGKPLRRTLKGHRRLRVGDYRIIHRVDDKARTVHIVAIGHRKGIYD